MAHLSISCDHGVHTECKDITCACSCHSPAITGTIKDADVLANRRASFERAKEIHAQGPNPAHVDLFTRAARVLAHTDGPDTAKEAAVASQVRKATNRYELLLRYNQWGPATTEFLWLTMPAWSDLAEIRRRATDLLAGGLLERTGRTAKTTSGRNAEVLRISEDGKRVLETLAREER